MKSIWVKNIFLVFFLTFAFDPAITKASTFVDHVRGDLESTFLNYPAIVLAGGVIGALSVYKSDSSIDNYFVDHQISSTFDSTMGWIGNPYILNAGAAALYGASLFGNNEKLLRTSETLMEALVFNDLMTLSLKYSFSRTRPNGNTLSFPSGHTSTAFTIATVLQSMHGSTFGVPAYMIAGLISFSRLDGHYHYLSDIVFGAALGSAIGWGTSLHHKKAGTKFLITPMLDRNRGIMLSFAF